MELQKKLDGDRNQMQLWVIKAKQEHDEKEEGLGHLFGAVLLFG